MGPKHKEHIFDAIKTSLFEQEVREGQRLNYNKLYDRVNEKLKESRNNIGISPRDFNSELTLLVPRGKD